MVGAGLQRHGSLQIFLQFLWMVGAGLPDNRQPPRSGPDGAPSGVSPLVAPPYQTSLPHGRANSAPGGSRSAYTGPLLVHAPSLQWGGAAYRSCACMPSSSYCAPAVLPLPGPPLELPRPPPVPAVHASPAPCCAPAEGTLARQPLDAVTASSALDLVLPDGSLDSHLPMCQDARALLQDAEAEKVFAPHWIAGHLPLVHCSSAGACSVQTFNRLWSTWPMVSNRLWIFSSMQMQFGASSS